MELGVSRRSKTFGDVQPQGWDPGARLGLWRTVWEPGGSGQKEVRCSLGTASIAREMHLESLSCKPGNVSDSDEKR